MNKSVEHPPIDQLLFKEIFNASRPSELCSFSHAQRIIAALSDVD